MSSASPRGTRLVSFDGTETCSAVTAAPADERALAAAVADQSFSVRGGGLSYCLAGAADGAVTISTASMRGAPVVNDELGTVRVSAGACIGDLLVYLVAKGYWFPVLPGHPMISVGGCLAFNTHGKTQHDIGQMHDHVDSLRLFHPDHGIISCSRRENPDLFDLTVGGMGLTGVILDADLRVEALRGNSIRREAIPVGDYIEAVEMMEGSKEPSVHLYSWNDAARTNASFGRGVVYAESFAQGALDRRTHFRSLDPQRRGLGVLVPLWNRHTARAVNHVYRVVETKRRLKRMSCLDAAFPINGREGYFHAFGRRGFHEYQIIVPRDQWKAVVAEVKALIESTRACVTLSSLKLFAGEPRLLWFRGNGVCLTLDGPATSSTRSLFAKLDELAIELRAPVNLSKDSRLEAETVAAIFPGYGDFVEALHEFDPRRRVDSQLRRRIGV